MTKQLVGNIPSAIQGATPLGLRLDSQAKIEIALTLPIRNKADLDDYDAHLFNPADPLYHKYLSIQDMIDRYSPTQADYDAVVAFAEAQGLTITHTSDNRMLIDVSGPASTVENAFGVHLMKFQDKNGRVFHAPDREPSVPTAIAARLLGVIGMDDDAVVTPQVVRGKTPSFKIQQSLEAIPMLQQPVGPGDGGGGGGGGGGTTTTPSTTTSGTALLATAAARSAHLAGPYGVITPSVLRTAYNLNSVPSNGQGQILDLVEITGFNPQDITAYEDGYGLPHVPVQVFSVDGVTNNPSDTSSPEAALDIELAVAVAPGLSLIRVYDTTPTAKGTLDALNLLSGSKAYQTSFSLGIAESALSNTQKQSEGNILQYMISTANCFFAASGDWGVYDPGRNSVTAFDPASQGWACAVGGTTLSTDQYGNYLSEQTWNQGGTLGSNGTFVATGSGVSNYWAIRNQKPVITAASGGSTTMRNIPDVSLNAFTDYSIYFGGGWASAGGTSAATPIWAAFSALVNSRLNGTSYQSVAPLADFTSTLYKIAQGPRYSVDFHDIADGSNNAAYGGGPSSQAVTGYDLATGLGSFNGANLFNDLIIAAGGKP